VLASPLLASSPLPFKGQVWMRAAKLAQAENRPADARRWLDEVVKNAAPQAAGQDQPAGARLMNTAQAPVVELRACTRPTTWAQHVVPALQGVDLAARAARCWR
jgi:hypothetical protein